uniref:Uncharacterized protein n=1 Tax=Cacopsylla melanoneura TaxID=428564 RepID=A0A8D8XIQ9_9HEMI
MIKQITGNLDFEDGERFSQITTSLLNNQHSLQKQLDLQYTLNKDAIGSFEETVKNIEHNEALLQSKLLQLGFVVEKEFSTANVLYTKELCNQFIILYKSLLSVLQDVENSLTFCRLGTFHPSIIRPRELIAELSKLKKVFKNQMSFKIENLADLQKILEIDCRIENNKIIYFLSFPLSYETNFELYYLLVLLPVPTLEDNEYTTILPRDRYFLKSSDSIKVLNNMCVHVDVFRCAIKDVSNNKVGECELDALREESVKSCQFINLSIKENFQKMSRLFPP